MKRRNEISFWRFFVLSPSVRRQNEQTKWPFPASIRERKFYMSFISRNSQITDVADFIRYNKILYRTLWRSLVWKSTFFVLKCWYCYNASKYIITDIYEYTSIVQKVGIIGEQTIDAFGEMYYLANHGSLERSVNLVLQGFIHRHIHFRMRIVFFCISIHLRILVKKDEICTSIRTENSLALLIPNHYVLDDCPREDAQEDCNNAPNVHAASVLLYLELMYSFLYI